MVLTTQFDVSPSEKMDMEKLATVINEAITAISSKTSLPENEVLDILEKVRVDMVGNLKKAIQALEERGEIPNVDPGRLGMAIEEAIEAISAATDLNTDEITEVLTWVEGASFDHIVYSLRTRSRIGRSDHV
jgi:hypothetical protein